MGKVHRLAQPTGRPNWSAYAAANRALARLVYPGNANPALAIARERTGVASTHVVGDNSVLDFRVTVGYHMSVPDFQNLMLPLLQLAADNQHHTLAESVEKMARQFQLSDDDRAQLLRSGQTRLYNRVGWATTYLKKAGLLRAIGPGRFQLTERGQEVLAGRPASIDVAFLETRFPEMLEFRKRSSKGAAAGEEPPATFNIADGTWNQRTSVAERIRETLECSIPKWGRYAETRCIYWHRPSKTRMKSAPMHGSSVRLNVAFGL